MQLSEVEIGMIVRYQGDLDKVIALHPENDVPEGPEGDRILDEAFMNDGDAGYTVELKYGGMVSHGAIEKETLPKERRDEENLNQKIIELWHTSRTAMAYSESVPTRYDRMQYVRKSLNEYYPELITGLTPKKVWFAIEDAIN